MYQSKKRNKQYATQLTGLFFQICCLPGNVVGDLSPLLAKRPLHRELDNIPTLYTLILSADTLYTLDCCYQVSAASLHCVA